jgi:hypothetical protein
MIDGVGAVFKVCAMVEETLREFDILHKQTCINFFAPSSVNIVQYLFSCGSVGMVGTSRTREFVIEYIEEYRFPAL